MQQELGQKGKKREKHANAHPSQNARIIFVLLLLLSCHHQLKLQKRANVAMHFSMRIDCREDIQILLRN